MSPVAAPGHPECPLGSRRIVMVVGLGPHVKSITYRTPDGILRGEHSPGGNGTFLLVFPFSSNTCRVYFHGELTADGVCEPNVRLRRYLGRAGSPLAAAIKRIGLTDGKFCSFTNPECPAY